ncbi:MAG TPA: P1 family peptidase [Acidimicrobiia bacterium]|jgi:L-aminopeptidase/D-esterase-like protein|nr:P1 family peptidase [Acidimicrobiia bacterium]
MTITSVPGVEVGHWADPVAMTGCTVVVFPEPNVAAVEIRGAAPGSRETALLAPGMRVETIQAILLAGGSAFGLAAADGVMAELERAGRGHPTPVGPVPIVPTAVIFDLFVGDPTVRPGPAQGAAATRSASGDPVEMGSVGAGTGATVAGWRGPSAVKKGGLGSACTVVDDALVGALVVVNAVGDVFTLEGEPLTGGPLIPGPPAALPDPATNTTLVVIATNARLGRNDLLRVTVRAQDALAVCLRPGHTRYDGDAAFAVSCGEVQTSVDLVGEAAFVATGRAIEAALRAATTPGSG